MGLLCWRFVAGIGLKGEIVRRGWSHLSFQGAGFPAGVPKGGDADGLAVGNDVINEFEMFVHDDTAVGDGLVG